MKHWSTPATLGMLLYALTATAQSQLTTSNFPQLSDYVIHPKHSILSDKSASSKHSTLLGVLKASYLADVLEYSGQFTVFAPSNAAFKTLSSLSKETLLDPKNKKQLETILSYHIIAGKFTAATILKLLCNGEGKTSFTTLQGAEIEATLNGLDIVLTDKHGNNAKIISADTNQSNGVVHEIDKVLLPAPLF